jgi:hypothetical protein
MHSWKNLYVDTGSGMGPSHIPVSFIRFISNGKRATSATRQVYRFAELFREFYR